MLACDGCVVLLCCSLWCVMAWFLFVVCCCDGLCLLYCFMYVVLLVCVVLCVGVLWFVLVCGVV